MSDNPRPGNATVNDLALPKIREVRRRFEAAWEETLRNGSQPPDPESFLGDLGAADLPPLRQELARITQGYQERLSQTKLPARPDTPPETAGRGRGAHRQTRPDARRSRKRDPPGAASRGRRLRRGRGLAADAGGRTAERGLHSPGRAQR